jgi:hypothetical protein
MILWSHKNQPVVTWALLMLLMKPFRGGYDFVYSRDFIILFMNNIGFLSFCHHHAKRKVNVIMLCHSGELFNEDNYVNHKNDSFIHAAEKRDNFVVFLSNLLQYCRCVEKVLKLSLK